MVKYIILILLAYISVCYTNNTTQFVATNEWQTLQQGQAVPAGLHVRINLQTGLKEAKLIEKTSENKTTLSLSVQSNESVATPANDSIERIRKAIENVPTDEFNLSEDEIKKIKSKFKTYEQIRDDLKENDIGIKTDAEIIESLIQRYEKLEKDHDSSHLSETISIFEDLEYLAHQIDNAVQFIDYQGVEKLIFPNLINQTNSELRIHSLSLLGALTQNNPKAKIATFEKNSGMILMNLLSKTKDSKEVSKIVFAFGSLVRKFPLAQKEILKKSGFNVLLDILSSSVELKVKTKTLTLISDILKDYNDVVSSSEVDSEQKSQYKSVDIENELLKLGYCRIANEFFVSNKLGFIQDVVLTDEVTRSFLNSAICSAMWSECALFRHTLLVLKNNIDAKHGDAVDEDDRDYLKEVHKNIEKIVEHLYENNAKSYKDEL